MKTSIRNRTVPLPFQHIRLLILLVFGLAYVWVLPPFEAPDEPAHFARAYSLAEGQAVLKDHPRKLVVFLRDAMKERLAARHMEVQEVPVLAEMERCLREKKERIPNIAYNSAQYSPVPYLFHAAVIRLVMLFDPTSRGLMVSLYACRIVSLLVFVGLLWVAFLLFPALSWPLFWLSITPMALSQASVVSVDYIVFLSAAILLTAALGHVRGTASAVCLICSAFFLLLTRPPYLWLLLVPVTSVFLSRDKNKGSMAWLGTAPVVGRWIRGMAPSTSPIRPTLIIRTRR